MLTLTYDDALSVQEAVARFFEEQAGWRRDVASRFPDEPRNDEAAAMLIDVANTVRELKPWDHRFALLAPVVFPEAPVVGGYRFSMPTEAAVEAQAVKEYGMKPGRAYRPLDLLDFIAPGVYEAGFMEASDIDPWASDLDDMPEVEEVSPNPLYERRR